jgi:hypothetical protein
MRSGRLREAHHSDQGEHYAATGYPDLMAGRGVTNGKATVGKPEANGFAT